MKFVWYNIYAIGVGMPFGGLYILLYFYVRFILILRKAVGFVVTLRVKPLFEGLKPSPVNRLLNYKRGTPFLRLAVQEIIYKTIDF